MRVLLVDLNNFARYPTVAIGLLAALLRERGEDVEVFSPLSVGAPGVPREPPPRAWGAWEARARHWTATTPNVAVRHLRRGLERRSLPIRGGRRRALLAHFDRLLASGPEVVLVSTYLMYFDLCRELSRRCQRAGVPLLLGGSAFSQPDVVNAWSEVGAAGIVGGEVEPFLHELVRNAAEGEPLDAFPGVTPRGAEACPPARPLDDLDALPFPDYRDFPWHLYPNRITPILSGRGCAWGVCGFCSDVTSATGRSFRSRSPENLLEELETQAERQASRLFVFTDLKINSDRGMWAALLGKLPERIPGASWVGSVHVDGDGSGGLHARELQAARKAGMVRLTTGLESGSQRLLDRLAKGTDLERSSRFLRDAGAAGISVRVTMIVGAPGEEVQDVDASARFLEEHRNAIERVTLNRFQLMTGTPLHLRWKREPEGHKLRAVEAPRDGTVELVSDRALSSQHRAAVGRLIDVVHRINRRALRGAARRFEGVM